MDNYPVENNAWRRMTMVLLSAIITAVCGYLFYLHFQLDKGYVLCGGAVTFILLYFFLQQMWTFSVKTVQAFARKLDNTSMETIIGGTMGLLVGVLLGMLSGIPFYRVPLVGTYLSVVIFLLFSYFGLRVGVHRASDLLRNTFFWRKGRGEDGRKNEKTTLLPQNQPGKKVVDTSAIIDGRIYDVAISKFLEGTLVVPRFVIEELQHIADSEDSVRRTKGRRGLDILRQLQEKKDIDVEIVDDPINEEKEVDMKLLRLCHQLHASIITNDYNLNKVAVLQGIRVLNIHELANALKVVVYPGEVISLAVMKEGKELHQGVGYLEDGTMVVVEDGRNLVGKTANVTVTSVFQTAAGRMIFARRGKDGQALPVGN